MDPHRSKATGFWRGTGTANLTESGEAGKKKVIEYIAVSSDAAAVVTIESPSGTTIFQKSFGAAFTMSESFPPGMMECAEGDDVILKLSAGTTKKYNMGGYDITG